MYGSKHGIRRSLNDSSRWSRARRVLTAPEAHVDRSSCSSCHWRFWRSSSFTRCSHHFAASPYRRWAVPASLAISSIAQPLGVHLWQASLSTLLTCAVGLPGSYLFARFEFPGKRLLRALTTLPFVLPTVVVAVAFNALLGPRGWLNLGLMALSGASVPPIQFISTLGAILAAHVFYNTPVVLRLVGNRLGASGRRTRARGARAGREPLARVARGHSALLAPVPLAAALVLVFLFDFSSFGVVLLLGGPRFATLEVAIYTQALHMLNLPLAALLSLIQLACTLTLTTLYARLAPRVSSPSAPRAEAEALPGAAQAPASAFCRRAAGRAFLLLLVVSPLAGLALRLGHRSLEANPGQRASSAGLTLHYYRELFINRREALFYVPPIAAVRNSLLYAGVTVILSPRARLAGRDWRWLGPPAQPAGWTQC